MSPIPSASFSFTIVQPPAHGVLSGTGANRSYQPGADFNGSDSFTFKANDGAADSNTSTVTITVTEVNDSPTATDDSFSTDEDTNREITASDLTTNDSAGPANENVQVLTVTSVSPTADTHGTSVCRAGLLLTRRTELQRAGKLYLSGLRQRTDQWRAGLQCTTGTVNITVNSVNDAPTLNAIGNKTVLLGSTLTFTAVGTDTDLPPQTLATV